MLELPVGAVVLLVALVGSARSDPRKMRTALYLLALLIWALTSVAGLIIATAERFDQMLGAYALLALLVILLGTVLALAGFLIVTGITLLRREGRALSRLLGLGLGVGMLGNLGLWALVVVTGSSQWALALLLLGLPMSYLGFGFVAFLLYGALYQAIMGRRGGPVAAVVVLGSGLIRGKVPPLLAARIHRGRALSERFADHPPLLVTSGGKGPDEPVAEARSMADYLTEDVFPAPNRDRGPLPHQRAEPRLQHRTVDAARRRGPDRRGDQQLPRLPSRAADAPARHRRLLRRRPDGAPTARHYWPSAVIREFITVLRDHLALNAVLLSLAYLPLVIYYGISFLVDH
ncbi:MAG: YdcF family protein [Micropruina sp.]